MPIKAERGAGTWCEEERVPPGVQGEQKDVWSTIPQKAASEKRRYPSQHPVIRAISPQLQGRHRCPPASTARSGTPHMHLSWTQPPPQHGPTHPHPQVPLCRLPPSQTMHFSPPPGSLPGAAFPRDPIPRLPGVLPPVIRTFAQWAQQTTQHPPPRPPSPLQPPSAVTGSAEQA